MRTDKDRRTVTEREGTALCETGGVNTVRTIVDLLYILHVDRVFHPTVSASGYLFISRVWNACLALNLSVIPGWRTLSWSLHLDRRQGESMASQGLVHNVWSNHRCRREKRWMLLSYCMMAAGFLGFIAVSLGCVFSVRIPVAEYDQSVLGMVDGIVIVRSRSMARRSALGLKSEPLKPKLDQIRKQAEEHKMLVLSYASYARKLKLEKSKLVRIFADLSRNFTELVNNPAYKTLMEDNGKVNEGMLRQFEKEVKERIKMTRQVITEAKESFDNQLKIQKLKDTIFAVNEQLSKAKKQGAFSSLIAAKSIPRSLHCLSMKLMEERIQHPNKYTDEGKATIPALEDPNLYHYAIFSDNVLAASVVVNSAVQNAKDPSKHVFHVVTDKMNLGAMQVMFRLKDYNGAHVEVKAVEDYKFLNSSYVPVLKQLESANLQRFYFENKLENATKDTTNMKFRNPKYLSILNHLRFYLPEMYPKLHRILFLDDDIVVQKDLTGLWDIDMDGKVNGAVETCFGSFHRYAQYMNFSHPLIKQKFNPKACAWAYGMNFFDLDAWRKEKCTEEYHYWQSLNENRTLWKLGTLPPGLITFYSTTKPLAKSWHVLGLGYNPSISMDEIRNAAVVHFNGNMKPWLDIAMPQFKPLWSKYVDYDLEFVRGCNFIA